jgi:hypothetical protein
MQLFTCKRSPNPEVEHLREAICVLVSGLRNEIADNRRETAWLRAEVAAMRGDVAVLPSKWDAAATRTALELIGDANRRIGVEQTRAELLTDDERLFELAGQMAADGAGELLAARAKDEGH